MIEVPEHALDIELEAYVRGERTPRRLSLRDYEDRWLVLVFYPRDFTFVCPTELATFAELHEAFAAESAELLAASTDSWYAHRTWFESDERLAGVRYPVLADTTHRLSAAFGVLGEDGASVRATFVLAPGGVVRHVSITDSNVGRAPAETLRVVQALETGELCPAAWRPGQPTLSALGAAA